MSREDFPPTFDQHIYGDQLNTSHTHVAGDNVEGDKTVFGEAYEPYAVSGEDSVAGSEYHLDLRGEGGTPITVADGGGQAPEGYKPPIIDTLANKQYAAWPAAEAGAPTREIGGGHGGAVRSLGLVSVRRAVAQSGETGIRAFTEERRRTGRS